MITDAELGRMGYGPKMRASIRRKTNGPRGGRARHTGVVQATEQMEAQQMKLVRQYRGLFSCGWSPGRAAISETRQ
jgi:hypothetical protein